MIIRDVPRPSATCPECGEQDDLFWHCALQNKHGVYDWGTIVTCNKCSTPFSLTPRVLWTVKASECTPPLEGFGFDEG